MRIYLKMATVFLVLSSCKLAVDVMSSKASQNVGPIDTEGRSDIASPSNSDNKIYTTNRSFIYEVDQRQDKKHIKFELEMMVIPGSFNLNESKLKYKYYYDPKNLKPEELTDFGFDSTGKFRPEFSSFTESGNYFLFHPPRSKTLVCLEAAPFPYVPSIIKKGRKSKQYLFIPRGNWGKLGGSKITWTYEVDSVRYIHDTIPYSCRINAAADSRKGGHNTLQTWFNLDSGFTKWSYRFEDSTAIDFVLKKIR